jgi:hypothetical protein
MHDPGDLAEQGVLVAPFADQLGEAPTELFESFE